MRSPRGRLLLFLLLAVVLAGDNAAKDVSHLLGSVAWVCMCIYVRI